MARARLQRRRPRPHGSDEFAIAAHQLTAVKDPGAPIRAVVAAQPAAFAQQPYSLWRDDPELVRALNDRLLSGRD